MAMVMPIQRKTKQIPPFKIDPRMNSAQREREREKAREREFHNEDVQNLKIVQIIP